MEDIWSEAVSDCLHQLCILAMKMARLFGVYVYERDTVYFFTFISVSVTLTHFQHQMRVLTSCLWIMFWVRVNWPKLSWLFFSSIFDDDVIQDGSCCSMAVPIDKKRKEKNGQELNKIAISWIDLCSYSSGFVKGHVGEVPHHISYQPSFEKGALLTVVSSYLSFSVP